MVEASWWNDSWLYRKALTINSALVAGDLENFPVLVSLADAELEAKAQESGNDIVFINNDGAKLSHEIESCVSTTGTLVAWVKVPQLSGSYDQIIYMYYGNASASSGQAPEAVWDEDYKMVQHLTSSSPITRFDSTKNNNNGNVSGYDGDEATAIGKINGADNLDGENDSTRVNDSDSLNMEKISIEAWAKPLRSAYDYDHIVTKGYYNSGWNGIFITYIDPASTTAFQANINNSFYSLDSLGALNNNQWNYVVYS